jgi:hypothetical protein
VGILGTGSWGRGAAKTPRNGNNVEKYLELLAASTTIPTMKQTEQPKLPKRSKHPKLFVYTLAPFDQVFRFKISLQGINPPIWRVIDVPSTYDFWNLHCAIQDSMGWLDCHLHEFRIVNPKTGQRVRMILDEEDTSPDVAFGWEEQIAEYFVGENKTAEYEYDFGDEWEHLIGLEGVYPREKGVAYPRCLAGESACPPEDVGGVPGYEMTLEILKDPKHPVYKDTKRWVGKGFDSEWFHPGEVHFTDPQVRWEMAFGVEEKES